MRHVIALALLVGAGCGVPILDPPDAGPRPLDTVVSTEGFDQTCATDNDCVGALVGDICACGCAWDGLAARARADYDRAALRVAMACAEIPDCADCQPPFVWCDAGTCRARSEGGPCGCPEGTVCTQYYDSTCAGGSPVCVSAVDGCAADPDVPAGRRACDPDCEITLCGVAGSCRAPGGQCGASGGQPERDVAVHCYAF